MAALRRFRPQPRQVEAPAERLQADDNSDEDIVLDQDDADDFDDLFDD